MSGGVDSAVAALLAKRMGYECEGVTMKLYGDCIGAGRAAEALMIKHREVDFSREFQKRVIEPFICSYEAGETPNPCIGCNTYIKFGMLYEYALSEGFDKLVTGHYARIEEGPDGALRLKRAADVKKDQSYFLYGLDYERLRHILFPLGGLTKQEVRGIAAEAGLPNAKKRESQDICFVPDGGHARFIAGYRGFQSAGGDFVDTEGRVLGRHGGIERFTIGQRKKLGITLGRPVFVKEIRPNTGEVVLADEEEIFVSRIGLTDVNWLSGERDMKGSAAAAMRVSIAIRYNAKPVQATIKAGDGGRILAEFDEPARAPAKGQAAVMYDGEYVIGGGKIEAVW